MFLTLLAALGLSSALADNWPRFQGPLGTGVSQETGLKLTGWGENGPEILWKTTLHEGFGGAAIAGDEVFILDRRPGEADHLLCLDLANGAEKWRYDYDYPGNLPHPGSRGVPLVTENSVFFIGGFGQVHCVSRQTKKAEWVVDLQKSYGAEPPRWGWAQSPILSGNVIVVPAMSGDAGLIGLDAATGKELWRTEGFGNSHSTPVILTLHGVEQAVFVATGDKGTTISVEPATGKVLWKTDLYFNKIPIPFPIKVAEDLVFLTGGYEAGSRMIRVSPQWEVTPVFTIERGAQMGPPIVVGEHIYFLANENANHNGEKRATGGLACMDLNGKILWNTGTEPFMGRGNMILVDGKLLIQDGEIGYLRVVEPSPQGYRELAMADVFGKKEQVDAQIRKQEGRGRAKLPDFKYWSPMALSNGRLILRGQEQVVCLKLK